MRVLVTAGNTREKIDHVRDWGNIFTGQTGLRIARAIAPLAEVDLLSSNPAHLVEIAAQKPAIRGHGFTSHADLRMLLEKLLRKHKYDAVFMTAAVADYRPAGVFAIVSREKMDNDDERWIVRNVQASKVKSSHRAIAVAGEPTEKLIDLFRREWSYRGLLVKFKLEVGISRDELIRIGQESRKASGADFLVANTLEMVEGPEAGAFLLSDAGEEWVPREQLPDRMASLIRSLSHSDGRGPGEGSSTVR